MDLLKALVIFVSYHHNNTEKIAKTMADTLGAEMKNLDQIQLDGLADFDLVGFGSGIYFGKHEKSLIEFAGNLPQLNGKRAFIFSKSGVKGKKVPKFHEQLKSTITSKGYEVVGEFNCPGFDSYGALKLIGGISKGRPNEEDLTQAQAFAHSMKEKA